MNQFFKIGVLFLLIAIYPCVVFAQGGGVPPPNPPAPVPIGGIELLLMAGGALGLKKIISSRKKK
ncbi:hypothetical protein LVD15_16265 [Fulvivirga maritima]|uniref:hypothetical protein n=1 Tax=Fulvivirga maritima TaxID=2904247 RepID=UPI001F47B6B5|nr:hypothetical protein [Fulvivirga maritima]UII24855.1 hypothetical protein LVD15_16265 [Fulvivirga maritima]